MRSMWFVMPGFQAVAVIVTYGVYRASGAALRVTLFASALILLSMVLIWALLRCAVAVGTLDDEGTAERMKRKHALLLIACYLGMSALLGMAFFSSIVPFYIRVFSVWLASVLGSYALLYLLARMTGRVFRVPQMGDAAEGQGRAATSSCEDGDA